MGRPLAVVTGASGGIGAAIARELAGRRHDLVLVARTTDALDALASELSEEHGVAVGVRTADLAAPGAGRVLGEALVADDLVPDVLVNNAGVGDFGLFHESDPDRVAQMVELNVATVVGLTRALLPAMVERGSGRVLNVASVAAFLPGPLMAVYYATKSFVLSFSEAVAEELGGTGVTVTVLCPGPTRTGFQDRADMGDSRLLKGPLTDAAPVAKAGVDGMLGGKRLVVPGVLNKLSAVSPRLVPRRVVPPIIRRVQGPAH
jgi:short-subunit dehydrogenase